MPAVTPDMIYLTISCGSVVVTAIIVAPNHTMAEKFAEALAPLIADTTVAASALGVPLLAVTPAVVSPPQLVPALSPPPQPSPPPLEIISRTPPLGPPSALPDGATGDGQLPANLEEHLPFLKGALAVLVASIVGCLCVTCALCYFYRTRRTENVVASSYHPRGRQHTTAVTPSHCEPDWTHRRVKPPSFTKKQDSLLWEEAPRTESTVDLRISATLQPAAPPPPPMLSEFAAGLSRGLEIRT